MVRISKAERARIAAEQLASANRALTNLASFIETEYLSRAATLECLLASYGPSPSREREDAVGLRAKATRMAMTIPSNRTMEDRIADCSLLIERYTSPDVASVPEGKMGRRDAAQEKAYRAAAQWLSQARKDCGLVVGETTAQKNLKAKKAAAAKAAAEATKAAKADGTREPHHNGTTPDTSEVPAGKPAKAERWTVERFAKHAEMQMASLLACLNAAQKDTKAGIAPILSSAVQDAKALIDEAIGTSNMQGLIAKGVKLGD